MDRIVKVVEPRRVIKELTIEGISSVNGILIYAPKGLEVPFNEYFRGLLIMTIQATLASGLSSYIINALHKGDNNYCMQIEFSGSKMVVRVMERVERVRWEVRKDNQ